MERITISLEDDLARKFDELIRSKGYVNRSEAMRDILRDYVSEQTSTANSDCIATLGYVYNHHALDLAERLTSAQHEHHDLTLSTLHVHLDHDNCLEVTVLRGRTQQVKAFADAVIAQKGVHHGKLHLIPVETTTPYKLVRGHGHVHLTP